MRLTQDFDIITQRADRSILFDQLTFDLRCAIAQVDHNGVLVP
jgi:hypothetical protein